ncbi:MAG: hypothetical protein LBC30_02535 [Puniceicoccales bacterium]|nr:hypothetical protein [Puniceicoccales bacterium]
MEEIIGKGIKEKRITYFFMGKTSKKEKTVAEKRSAEIALSTKTENNSLQ